MKSSDWQPMGTAPLNPYGRAFGPTVLIWCAADDTPVACYYEPSGGIDNKPRWVVAGDGAEIGEGDALAWMPIAAPWAVLDRSQTVTEPEPDRSRDDFRAIGHAWSDPMCRAFAQGYDREDAAQRGEPDPWALDDPADAGNAEQWTTERVSCVRAGLDAAAMWMANGSKK